MPKEFYEYRIKELKNEIRMNKNAVNIIASRVKLPPKSTKKFFQDLIKRQEKELKLNKSKLAKAERKGKI